MKYLFFILSFWSAQLIAQWPNFTEFYPISWQNQPFNYYPNGEFGKVFVVEDQLPWMNGYLVFGRGVLCSPTVTNAYTKNFAARISNEGGLLWTQLYSACSDSINEAYSLYSIPVALTKNHRGTISGGYVTWRSEVPNSASQLEYLAEYDLDGSMIERHLIDSSANAYFFRNVVEDFTDSTLVFCGVYRDSTSLADDNIPDGADAMLLKLDTLGNIIWQHSYENTFEGYQVIKSDFGGFWIVSVEWISNACDNNDIANVDLVIIKTDDDGNELARTSAFGGYCADWGFAVEVSQNEIAFGGAFSYDELPEECDINNLGGPYVFRKFVVDGNAIIEQTEFTHSYELVQCYRSECSDFLQTPDNGFVLAGVQRFDDSLEEQYQTRGLLWKVDENFDSLWVHSYRQFYNPGPDGTDAGDHYIFHTTLTPDSGFVCAGLIRQFSYDPQPQLWTPWLFKVDKYGCLEPGCQFITGIEEQIVGLQNTLQVYPNPVENILNVAFHIPPDQSAPQNSELILFDLQGKEIFRQSLSQNDLTSVQLPVNNLSKGIYLLHWVSGAIWLDSLKVMKE
jgi:hypothetical protein